MVRRHGRGYAEKGDIERMGRWVKVGETTGLDCWSFLGKGGVWSWFCLTSIDRAS